MLRQYLTGYDQYQDFLVTRHAFVTPNPVQAKQSEKNSAPTIKSYIKQNRKQQTNAFGLDRYMGDYDQYQDFLVTQHVIRDEIHKDSGSKAKHGINNGSKIKSGKDAKDKRKTDTGRRTSK